nr:tetratricopeptide repeat protein [uncultured Porphyromonas sp.]
MRSKRFLLALMTCILATTSLVAQGIKSDIRRANKLYHAKDYARASQEYRRALLRDSLSAKARFGLSASIYAEGRYDEAKTQLERILQQEPQLTPQQQAGVLHNLGNVAMKKKDYQAAVHAYEEALIRHPEDGNTRYNLALAQKLLQQNKNNQQSQQGQNQDPNKNKDQDKQDPKKDQQNQNKPEQQKPQEKGQDKQGQPNEQRSGELSKEQAEQILRSFRTDDDKTRRRVEQRQREQQQQNRNKNKKRW